MSQLENIILDHFGTKTLFAERMKVTRMTAHRWVKNPNLMQLKDLKRLSDITKMSIADITRNL
jgi:hypothetical protein